MKKFTFLMIALFIAAMGFAQMKVQGQLSSQAFKKKVSVEKTHGQLMSQPFKKAVKVSTTTRAVTGTLQLCGEMGENAIGTNSAGTLAAAARFEASALTSYVGQYITKINVGIANADVITSAKVAILTGTTDAPVVALEQSCTFQTGMNEVLLPAPYQIPAETAIMVAYEIVVTGGYPLGTDPGPVVAGANLVNMEGLTGAFDPLSDLSSTLTYNFIISATVEDDPSSPLLTVAPNSMVFVGFVGDAATEAQAATLSTRNISSNITIATAAPFEVSTDNTTFSASATMAEEGTFYVRYIPATEESTAVVTGTVTVSATGADDATIAINAITFDCTSAITTLPYEEGFESGIPCWTYFSNNTENGLGVNQLSETNYAFVFSSYDRAENGDYNQYLITPELGFTEDVLLSFDYAGTSSYSEGETFAVLASSTTNDIAAFSTNLSGEIVATNVYTDGFETYLVTVPAGTKYIAINYYSDYQYRLLIDNFSFTEVPTVPEIALASVAPATGTTVQTGVNVTLSGVVKNNGSALTSYKVAYTVDANSPAEYNVTGINVATGENNEFTHTTPIVFTETGEHTIVVTISNPNGEADSDDSNNSITVVWNAISCDAITEFPYEEGFDNGIPECWTIIDADGDGHNWMALTDLFTSDVTEYVHGGTDAAISQSYENYVGAYDANNWMISSAITVPSEGEYLAAWWARSMDASYPDSYSVYIGTEPTVAGMTANAAILSHTPTEWEMKSISLASYAGQTIYIGFNHVDNDNYVLMIDDFSVFAAPTTAEIALTSVTPANNASIPSGQDITIGGVVTNNGVTLTSYKVAYTVDGGEAVEYTVSGINVALGSTNNFTHTTPISGLTTGAHTIVVTVSDPNGAADGDASDNSMTINITVTAPLAYGCYFETDPEEEGWTFVDSDNDGYNWTWENSSSSQHMTTYEGIGCLYSESYSGAALTPDNWAIAPAIEIEDGPISVSLYAKGQDPDYAAEHFQIYVGTSADVATMTAVSEEFVATDEYTQYTADVPASYVGQTIYVAIRHYNVSDEFVLVVDNFEVLAYGHVVITDVEENIAETIAVYPNPTSSMVTIANAEGKDIIVVNSLGQVVASIENAAANQTIDVSNFANGTYFVKVDGEVVKLNVVK